MRRARGRIARLACFALIIGAGLVLHATSAGAGVCSTGADVSWVAPGGGSWNDTANWDTGALPQSGDDVCIDTTLVGNQITFPSGSVSLNSLDMVDDGDVLMLEGGFFGIGAESSVGNIHLFSETATLQVDASVEVRDEFAWRRGTLQGAGSIKAFDARIWSTEAADCLCVTTPRYLNGPTLSMSGPGSTWSQWGDIIGLGGGTIDNSGTLTILQGDGDILRDVGVTDRIDLVNTGTILKDAAGPTGSPDTNSYWDVDADFRSGSDLQIETRTMTFAGPSSFAGDIDLDQMPNSGQLTFAASGTGVTHQLVAGSTLETHHGGVVRFEGGTTTIGGTYDSWITEITGAGTASFDNELSPATIHFLSVAANGVLAGDADVDIDNPGGNFSWTGGTISGTGDVDATGASSDIEGASPKILNGRNVILDGDVDWGNPLDASDPNGDIVMGQGGDLRILGRLFMRTDADVTYSGTGPAPSIVNQGLITKSAGATDGSNETKVGVFVSHFGTNVGEGIETNVGTLELGAGGSILGPLAANGTAMLEFSDGVFDLSPTSAVTGSGVVKVRGADLNVSGTWDVSGETRVTDGTLQTFFGVDATTNELDVTGGTLDGASNASFLTTGPANLTGGEIAGGVWEFDGDLAFDGLGAFLVTGGTVQMDGDTDWLSGDIHTQDAMFVNNGTFDILGDDDLQYNGAGSLSQFTNNGTVVKSAGLDGESTNVDGAFFQNDAVGPGGWRVEDGTMRVIAGGSSSGALSVSAEAVLDIAGDVFAIDGATTGAGTIENSAGNVTIGDDEVVPFDFPGHVKITGGVFEVVSAASTAILTIESGTLSGAATMTVEQSLDWSGGSMEGSGETVLLDAVFGAGFEGEISGDVALLNRDLLFGGNVLWSGGDIDTGATAPLIRVTGSVLMGGDAGDVLFSGTPGNEGVIDIDDGILFGAVIDGERNIAAQLNNMTGQLQVQYGQVHFAANSGYDPVTDTLSGGIYEVGSVAAFPTAIDWGEPVARTAANITLEGADSWIGAPNNDSLCQVAAAGALRLDSDETGPRVLACSGQFVNAGQTYVLDGSAISATAGYAQHATGHLGLQVLSPDSGDYVLSGGPIALDGLLSVDVSLVPTDPFSVSLLSGGSTSGSFDEIQVNNLPAGWLGDVEVSASEVRLNVSQPPEARTITLSSSATTRTFGQRFTLSGKVSSADPACASVPVTISRDVLGGAVAFSNVATVNADGDGDYTLNRTADRGAVYKATVAATVDCAAATSATKTVKVKKKVTLTAPRKVAKGTTAKIKVAVAPCSGHQKKKVTLQRKTASGFKKVATKATNAKCVAIFKVVMKKTTVFRAVAPKTDADHLAGTSATRKVRAI